MSGKAKLCALAHEGVFTGVNMCVNAGAVCMIEPNIALVKFFLSSQIGTGSSSGACVCL